jgi:hypothetical protein
LSPTLRSAQTGARWNKKSASSRRGGFETCPLDCPIKSGNDRECELPPNPLFDKEGEVLPRKDMGR